MFPENREVFQICIQIISLLKLYNLDDKKYYEFLSRLCQVSSDPVCSKGGPGPVKKNVRILTTTAPN